MQQGSPDWRIFTTVQGHGPDSIPAGGSGPPDGGRVPRPTVALIAATVLGVAGGALTLVALLALLLFAFPDHDRADALDPTGLGAASVEWRPGQGSLGDLTAPLIVDVAGAVLRPGLHELPAGSRVGDAIAAAGGFGARVDAAEVARTMNLALPLMDGAKILVPTLGSTDQWEAVSASDARVDLNGADRAALEALPGVGPVTATRIVDARATAPFRDVGELRTRDVVGEALFERIKDLVRVGS
jgi:competence protein ComEA